MTRWLPLLLPLLTACATTTTTVSEDGTITQETNDTTGLLDFLVRAAALFLRGEP